MIKREKIYDTYWYFAYERNEIFINKLNGEKMPYTEDKILQEYKFCNSYRVNDRVSQYLLKNVIYKKKYSNEDTIFRIVLFKIFNKESTWELLESEIGDIKLETFSFDKYSKILSDAKSNEIILYNDAYISCANKAFGYEYKHENNLALLEKMFIEDKMYEEIILASNMEIGFNILRKYPLIGDFMAYQIITDINYSNAVDFSENEFTVVGPGSIRGIKKCFISTGSMSKEDVIKYMYDNQEKEFKRLGLDFKYLGGRKLQLIDCQNIFCELDKYCRAAYPEIQSNRVKIKKKYSPTKKTISYIYPPKWNLK